MINANQIDPVLYHTFTGEHGKKRIARIKTAEEIKQEIIELTESHLRDEKLNKAFRQKRTLCAEK